MILALSILLPALGSLADALLKSNVPTHVTTAVQSAIAALESHKQDLLTKADFDAQRG